MVEWVQVHERPVDPLPAASVAGCYPTASIVLVVHSDRFEFPLPPEHRFPLVKYRLLREAVAALPAGFGAELVEAPRATRDELLLAHDAGYVDDFLGGRLSAAAMQRIGFPWSPEFVERTLRSCGGTLAATRAALRDRGAVHLAGGTHHARRDRGAGYCVFNDCAVGARLAQALGVERVLIVDTDVHQGDGSAAIFAGDDSVFTFSIHGAANFPAAKAQSDLDIALPKGTGDDDYLAALGEGLLEAFVRSGPQLVFFLSGADPHEGDRLGTLKLTADGLRVRDDLVLAATESLGVPCVTVMGGGYGRRIEDTVAVHAATVARALVGPLD